MVYITKPQVFNQQASVHASELTNTHPVDALASMHALVKSWIHVNDSVFFLAHSREDIDSTLKMLFNEILDLYDNFDYPRSMFPIAVMYADRFVARFGIQHNQVFNLLLIASVVTMKFWFDGCRVTNRRAAEVFSYPLSEINVMEVRFLRGIDYKLSCTTEELSTFICNTVHSYQTARFEALRAHLFGAKLEQEPAKEVYQQGTAAAATAQTCVQRVTKRRSSIAATACTYNKRLIQ